MMHPWPWLQPGKPARCKCQDNARAPRNQPAPGTSSCSIRIVITNFLRECEQAKWFDTTGTWCMHSRFPERLCVNQTTKEQTDTQPMDSERRRLLREHERRRKAALTVQRTFRAQQGKILTAEQAQLVEQKKAALLIEKTYKGRHSRRSHESLFKRKYVVSDVQLHDVIVLNGRALPNVFVKLAIEDPGGGTTKSARTVTVQNAVTDELTRWMGKCFEVETPVASPMLIVELFDQPYGHNAPEEMHARRRIRLTGNEGSLDHVPLWPTADGRFDRGRFEEHMDECPPGSVSFSYCSWPLPVAGHAAPTDGAPSASASAAASAAVGRGGADASSHVSMAGTAAASMAVQHREPLTGTRRRFGAAPPQVRLARKVSLDQRSGLLVVLGEPSPLKERACGRLATRCRGRVLSVRALLAGLHARAAEQAAAAEQPFQFEEGTPSPSEARYLVDAIKKNLSDDEVRRLLAASADQPAAPALLVRMLRVAMAHLEPPPFVLADFAQTKHELAALESDQSEGCVLLALEVALDEDDAAGADAWLWADEPSGDARAPTFDVVSLTQRRQRQSHGGRSSRLTFRQGGRLVELPHVRAALPVDEQLAILDHALCKALVRAGLEVNMSLPTPMRAVRRLQRWCRQQMARTERHRAATAIQRAAIRRSQTATKRRSTRLDPPAAAHASTAAPALASTDADANGVPLDLQDWERPSCLSVRADSPRGAQGPRIRVGSPQSSPSGRVSFNARVLEMGANGQGGACGSGSGGAHDGAQGAESPLLPATARRPSPRRRSSCPPGLGLASPAAGAPPWHALMSGTALQYLTKHQKAVLLAQVRQQQRINHYRQSATPSPATHRALYGSHRPPPPYPLEPSSPYAQSSPLTRHLMGQLEALSREVRRDEGHAQAVDGSAAANRVPTSPFRGMKLLGDEDQGSLPAGWVEQWDRASRAHYYYNEVTRASSWSRPRQPSASSAPATPRGRVARGHAIGRGVAYRQAPSPPAALAQQRGTYAALAPRVSGRAISLTPSV